MRNKQFDIIVSNPPYIPYKDRDSLDETVKSFEPNRALFGGEDGLQCYREIAEDIMSHNPLKSGGVLALEIGIHQVEDVILF